MLIENGALCHIIIQINIRRYKWGIYIEKSTNN